MFPWHVAECTDRQQVRLLHLAAVRLARWQSKNIDVPAMPRNCAGNLIG